MSKDPEALNDADLVRAWLSAATPEARPNAARDLALDHGTLAAYLDGTLAPEARDAVEARLAADPESLDLLLAARAALAEPSPPAPDALVRRASAWAEAVPAGGGGLALSGGPLAWFFGSLRWSGVLAAIVVAGFLGFELGRMSTSALAAGETTLAQAPDSGRDVELDLALEFSLTGEGLL